MGDELTSVVKILFFQFLISHSFLREFDDFLQLSEFQQTITMTDKSTEGATPNRAVREGCYSVDA